MAPTYTTPITIDTNVAIRMCVPYFVESSDISLAHVVFIWVVINLLNHILNITFGDEDTNGQ